MSDPVQNLRAALGGAAGATAYSGMPAEDLVRRAIIRDSKLASGDWLQGSGVTSETDLPRGLVLGRELSSSGKLILEVRGHLNIVNGGTGNLTLRLYGSPDANPNVARGSMGTILTGGHILAIADPGGAGGTNGSFLWRLEIEPLGQPDLTNTQRYKSFVEYQRYSGDAVTTSTQIGRLTYDFHADTIVMPTTQKAAGLSTSTVDIFSIDAWVDNGQSGVAA